MIINWLSKFRPFWIDRKKNQTPGVDTADSTENSRKEVDANGAVDLQRTNGETLTLGFAPLAASASMPAVIVSGSAVPPSVAVTPHSPRGLTDAATPTAEGQLAPGAPAAEKAVTIPIIVLRYQIHNWNFLNLIF